MNYAEITQLARELRKNQTWAETLLWKYLRGRKMEGAKFLRQHPILYDKSNNGFFIPDFYCKEFKLIIEVDGKVHDFQKEYDNQRTEILNALGLRVVRFTNDEVTKDLIRVLEDIRKYVTHPLSIID